MKKLYVLPLVLLALGITSLPTALRAQGSFELVSGKAFENAVPSDFYLEGSRIPVQKRNAVLVTTPAGARVVMALIDTSGYSSQIQQKYEGMIISEGNFSVCGQKMGVGSFGFGFTKPAATSKEDMKLTIYNQAGTKVAECAGKVDASITQPAPLHVVPGKTAKLALGRHSFELK
jgi:hypothetical protein